MMRPVQAPAAVMGDDALRLEWRLRLLEQSSPVHGGTDVLGLRCRLAELERELLRRSWEAS